MGIFKKEVADSEDVELIYKWEEDEQVKGHVVAVTGVYETDSQKKTVGIKHDRTQKKEGGTVQEFPEITVDDHKRMVLHNIGKKRVVSGIISESPGEPFTGTGVEDQNSPLEFYLGQNYPNPFNPTTTITYSVAKNSKVKLIVYNILGREVKRLVDGLVESGIHRIEFDGSKLSSGVYYYQLITKKYSKVNKMLLLK